jgi:hypothetical protein
MTPPATWTENKMVVPPTQQSHHTFIMSYPSPSIRHLPTECFRQGGSPFWSIWFPDICSPSRFWICSLQKCGPGSSVGIATGYGLDGPGIKSWWGKRFSAPVQTSPGAHPASCTMVTRSFPGIKSGQGLTLIPHPLLVPWSLTLRWLMS